MPRRLISSGSEFETGIGYSRAVVDGDYIFVSGTTGFNYETMEIPEDIAAQAEQCFKNIEAALNEAGADLRNVVRVRYIVPHRDNFEPCWPSIASASARFPVPHRDNFEPCWPVCRKYLGAARPAATMLVAGLLDKRMKIEIEVTASMQDA